MVTLTITAECDVCRHRVHTGHSTDTAMLTSLTATGWQLAADVLLCPDCAADAVCTAVGHVFAPWRPCHCRGRLPGHAGAVCGVEFRWCERCSVHEEHPTLDPTPTRADAGVAGVGVVA